MFQFCLQARTLGEDYVEITLESSSDISETWRRLFVELSSGGNQVIIDGHVTANSVSGILIDDISLWPCAQFGELHCMYIASLKVAY